MNHIVADRTALLTAAAVPFTAALWVFASAEDVGLEARIAIGLLAVTMAVVVFNPWSTIHPLRALVPMARETGRPPALQTPGDASRSRWLAWESRGDAHNYSGRARATLALSVVCTGSLLSYTWLP